MTPTRAAKWLKKCLDVDPQSVILFLVQSVFSPQNNEALKVLQERGATLAILTVGNPPKEFVWKAHAGVPVLLSAFEPDRSALEPERSTLGPERSWEIFLKETYTGYVCQTGSDAFVVSEGDWHYVYYKEESFVTKAHTLEEIGKELEFLASKPASPRRKASVGLPESVLSTVCPKKMPPTQQAGITNDVPGPVPPSSPPVGDKLRLTTGFYWPCNSDSGSLQGGLDMPVDYGSDTEEEGGFRYRPASDARTGYTVQEVNSSGPALGKHPHRRKGNASGSSASVGRKSRYGPKQDMRPLFDEYFPQLLKTKNNAKRWVLATDLRDLIEKEERKKPNKSDFKLNSTDLKSLQELNRKKGAGPQRRTRDKEKNAPGAAQTIDR